MAKTHFDAVYASPLNRAHQTAQALYSALESPPAPIIINPDLREQHFGDAEGGKWTLEPIPGKTLEEMYAMKVFLTLRGRQAKFPNGESLDDLAHRAERALAGCVFPYLAEHGRESSDDAPPFHIVVVSHGLCISELIAALVRLDPDSPQDKSYTGLLNTAWTRVSISLKDSSSTTDTTQAPKLNVRILDVNNAKHLQNLDLHVEAEQEASAEAREFFGGGGKSISITNAVLVSDAASTAPPTQ
ncbi:hypothetical protein HGRIS_011649 [Hohenbuehelia grisea]